MSIPQDNSNYVGFTYSPPGSVETPYVVVVGGVFQKSFADQTAAQNYYNTFVGSTTSGATANSPTPGNSAPATPAVKTTPAAPSQPGSLTDFVKQNPWLVAGGAVLLGALVVRR